MGSIIFEPGTLISSIGEIVGYKSGLTLTADQIIDKLRDTEYLETIIISDSKGTRLGSDEFQDLVLELLYRLGNISSPTNDSPIFSLLLKYKKQPEKLKLTERVIEMFTEEGRNFDPNHPEIYIRKVVAECGPLAGYIGIELLEAYNSYFHRNIFSRMRIIQWKDTKDLSELFDSESLSTLYGTFFDQRYIDYLHQNFEDIDKINWRKFEGFTAEYFERLGFQVEIGRGRKDGGVDIRVWPEDKQKDSPPLILVQCKRVKKTIEELIVKALYADIDNAKAESGLIVTTSALSKASVKLCQARSYPIGQANRETLKKWIESMRTPGMGIFLGK